MTVVEFLLGLAAGFAAAVVGVNLIDAHRGDEALHSDQAKVLAAYFVAFVLALGFLGLLLK